MQGGGTNKKQNSHRYRSLLEGEDTSVKKKNNSAGGNRSAEPAIQ